MVACISKSQKRRCNEIHQKEIRKTKNAKVKHNMVQPSLQPIRFNKRWKDIPSIGSKTCSKKPQTFNSSTVKVSYRCMNNMSKIIKRHNKKLTLKPRDKTPKRNRRKKAQCPMEGNRQVTDVVYRCDITRPLSKKECPGLAEGEWKSRFYNHKSSFIYKIYSNKTTIPSSI